MHDPSILLLAIPKESEYWYCHCIPKIMYNVYYVKFMILTYEKNKFEVLLEICFVCKRFSSVKTVRIYVPKIFIFFFHMLFWGSAKPSFGWYKVTKN